MRIVLILLILVNVIADASAQKSRDTSPLECGPRWPPETKADTVTRLIFTDKSYPVSDFPAIKPLSNYSFTSRSCELNWFPINSNNVGDFVSRTLRKRSGQRFYYTIRIQDTLKCRLFEKDMQAIYYKHKRSRLIVIYEQKTGYQMVFLATIRGLAKPQAVIAFLETLFKKP